MHSLSVVQPNILWGRAKVCSIPYFYTAYRLFTNLSYDETSITLTFVFSHTTYEIL